MRAIILSAGLGERLRPITLKWAKPAVPFLNVPMIGFPLFWLETVGLEELVVNTHYLPQTVEKAVKDLAPPKMPVHFPHEKEILGSGGGIWNAKSILQKSQDFFVANGDGVVLFPHHDVLRDMLKRHREHKALATLLVCPLEGVGTRIPGVWLNKNSEVRNFGKAPLEEGLSCLHYASFFILSSRIWPHMPEGSSNILYDVLQPLIARGEKVLAYNCPIMKWFETGNEQDYLNASGECLQLLSQNENLGQALADVLTRFDASWIERADVSRRLLVGRNATAPKDLTVEGFAVIGEDCTVSPGTRLEKSVLLPASTLSGSIQNKVVI